MPATFETASSPQSPTAPRSWDIFCRVVDNYGDVGVCWRLAAELASRGFVVRLYIDDASALAWMAPAGHPAVTVLDWAAAERMDIDATVSECVVEAFGCNPPDAYLAALARASADAAPSIKPVWINLEYLSAEEEVERNHALPSPQMSGPAAGLLKWFYYPGFSEGTGGLLRERGLIESRDRFDAASWLAAAGIERRPGERLVTVFAYDVNRLPQMLASLPGECLLLVTPGAVEAVSAAVAGCAGVRLHALPWLQQPDFDHLLWASELVFVRGEDSFVRAQWAAVPFVWQIYPQDDGVHRVKLEAFLDKFLSGAPLEIAVGVRSLWMRWNGFDEEPSAFEASGGHVATASPRFMADWSAWCLRWRARLTLQTDLSSQLVDFASGRR